MVEKITAARFARLAMGILLFALPSLLLHGVVREAAALFPLATGPHPYLILSHAGLLYFMVPLAVGSASVLFLAPGLFIALAFGRGGSVGNWLLAGLGISLPLLSVAAALTTALVGGPVTGSQFGLLCLALSGGAAAFTGWRARRAELPWPLGDAMGRFSLATCLLVPLGLFLALEPKFLWESFNGDGVHAFETSRLLLRHPLPFLPEQAGPLAQFPGLNSMLFSFPNGWFLRLFGEVEGAVRFPFLIYLTGLCAAILAVAEFGRTRPTRSLVIAVWISLLAFALAMVFSATYDPYSADIALPATQDTLLMVCFLGWVHAFLRREWGWLTLFTALTYTASPGGLMLLGFGLLAVPLVMRPVPWRPCSRAGWVLLACLVGGMLAPRLLVALGAPRPGEEHGPLGLLRHFAYLQFTDWTRVATVMVACGIVPWIALFLWRRQDSGARLLTLVTAGYFLFFFFLAHISVHQFVPAMVLPVAVAARSLSGNDPGVRPWKVAWHLTAIAAVLLSLPSSFALQDQRRQVAATISETVGDYAGSDPKVLRSMMLLQHLFPMDWESSVPDSSYGGAPPVWNYYAHHQIITDSTNYVLTRRDQPAPAGMHLVASDSDAALYVRSDSVWQAQLALRPPTPAGSRVYAIDRGILFHRRWPLQRGPHIFDTAAILARFGIDVTPILARLGVKR